VGAAAGDSVDVIAYGAFVIANTYTQAQVDSFLAAKLNANNPSYTGTLTGGTGVINIGSGQLFKDANGNVGIGTSSTTNYILRVNAASPLFGMMVNGTQAFTIGALSGGGGAFYYGTGNAEAMRIDSSGNLLVGQTSAGIANGIGSSIESSGLDAARITINHSAAGSSNGSFFMRFAYGGVQSGSISQSSTTNVAFNTSSDKRLKEDKGLSTDTSVIDNTEVHDFVWKSSGQSDRGVFAQDAYLVKPQAVAIGSDDVNEDGNIVTPWAVDYSKYVPDLIVYAQQLKKQAQEQQAMIASQSEIISAQQAALEQLKARVEALEGAAE
jgi:hypothetical protein